MQVVSLYSSRGEESTVIMLACLLLFRKKSSFFYFMTAVRNVCALAPALPTFFLPIHLSLVSHSSFCLPCTTSGDDSSRPFTSAFPTEVTCRICCMLFRLLTLSLPLVLLDHFVFCTNPHFVALPWWCSRTARCRVLCCDVDSLFKIQPVLDRTFRGPPRLLAVGDTPT